VVGSSTGGKSLGKRERERQAIRSIDDIGILFTWSTKCVDIKNTHRKYFLSLNQIM